MHLFQQQSVIADAPIDVAQVESQVQVLKSETIAAAVIKNLHLADDPEFVGGGGGLLGTLIGFVLNPIGFFSPSDHTASEFELSRRAINSFKSRLEINRIGLSYVIDISFQAYDSEKAAQVANAVADAYIVDQLEAKYQATRRASAWLQDRIKELRDQASGAERAVVEFKIKNNIVNTGGVDKPLLSQQQVAELSSQLVIARAHSAEAKARLDRINSVLKADLPEASFGETVTDTLKNEVVSKLRSQYLEMAAREADWTVKYGATHLAVVNLRNQMREIKKSIFDELKRLGETYKSDYAIAKQNEEGVQRELTQAIAKSQESDTAAITLHELESSAQTYKSLYENFLQRYMETVQQQSFPITEARVISMATRPLQKSHPRTLVDLAIAGFGGLILGFGLGMFRDLSDRVFRTSEQVVDLLRTNCIALIPLLTSESAGDQASGSKSNEIPGSMPDDGRRSGPVKSNNTLLSRTIEAVRATALVSDVNGSYRTTREKTSSFASSPPKLDKSRSGVSSSSASPSKSANVKSIVRSDNKQWAVVNEPFSRFAETIRSVKLAVDLDGTMKANRTIGFTSSLPNEGKSTIAVALAELASQVGARAILVDCDLRNPSLTRSLAPGAQSGLLELITGKATLDDVIWTEPYINMAFLPTVVKSRFAHSNEILSSEPVKELFQKLRERYDYVIVDLPPLAPIVDVRAMTHLVDLFIFVIEWGRTKIDIVEHALDHAQRVHQNMLGVVLNKVDMNLFARYANYKENYYYNKQYARYGYTE